MKLLSNGLMLFAGIVSLPASVTHAPPQDPVAAYRNDPRLPLLHRFFSQCPAQRLAHVFLAAADLYALDWRLLPSISYVETTGGKFTTRNNLFGWDSGRATFQSMTASIQAVANALASSSRYRDKDLEGLLRTYNPRGEYARKVKSVMRRISPAE